MTAADPTRGQLERSLSQRIQNLYQTQLGQRPERVICQFFDEKLAIVLENSVTQSERLLLTSDREEVAEDLRSNLDDAIEPQLKAIIEEVIGVSVVAILSDTALESGFSGIIAILSEVPRVRDPESIPKVRR